MYLSVSSTIRVLLVEGNTEDALFIARLLMRSDRGDFDVMIAKSLAEAMEHLKRHDYEVALLDLDLPDANGLEAFERIRALDSRLPVVMLTASEDEKLGIAAIESGVQDFLAKQHISGRMLDRVLRFAIARQLKVMGIQAAADTDPLTGLHNRRFLEKFFSECLSEAKTHLRPICLCILDVDHFKQINDRFGHFVGDVILKGIASLLNTELPAGFCITRIGGEEFALLMPNHDLEASGKRIESLLGKLAARSIQIDDQTVFVTASAGLIEMQSGESWNQAYVAADEALYKAKSLGRNQCQAIPRPRAIHPEARR